MVLLMITVFKFFLRNNVYEYDGFENTYGSIWLLLIYGIIKG